MSSRSNRKRTTMISEFSLESIGATPELRLDFAPLAAQGFTLARVSQAIRDQYHVLTAAGELHAEPSGTLLHMAARAADLPAVGDWVAARIVADGEAILHAVLARRTKFSRRTPGGRSDEQVVAANVDTVFLVSGLDHDFNIRRIERYLTLAHESGADPVLVLNKADLCAAPGQALERIREIAPSTPVAAVSALEPDGIAPLRRFLTVGRTVALLGSSGVGKSTIVNGILGTPRQSAREVREHDSRGRHTTSRRELIPIPGGGALIDTPGMRELRLWAGEESLEAAFGDIAALAAGCRFRDCSHSSEPGCGVRAALDSGVLSGGRWSGYEKLRAEIRHLERAADPLAAAAERRRWKAIHKAQRVRYRDEGR